ncbi:hypothetical protein JX265_002316 [Neoarthrinium moseri]|uniref:Secreted protein n=1 Tax=Neoarthrinium moseri TaxID=1658444 RepID=A0A9P9WUP6_9PEZI|nr:uncharacterized protein JN550_000128 [Neoarthrinium moseri]KAI1854676.1 hypothetical protein JX266_000794 [Neoarthrinium moseri]KAI1877946.1 hypothetical protein JN550_000128 [Neoarthrinium moseri]KAI1879362.1 hypothetical protein JX265_002316 [Neoarthrinium moseri]
MLYPQILLGLAATASAIDAYFHLGGDCDGPATLCKDLNPGVCCTSSGSNTVGYRGIPTDWRLSMTAYFGGGCSIVAYTNPAVNTNYVCIRPFSGDPPFTGTRYFFDSKKRAEDEPCTSTQKPDELILADGTRYNIAGLEDNVLNQL